MTDLEECVSAASRINERTSSLSEKKKTFEKDVLKRLGELGTRLARWASQPQPSIGGGPVDSASHRRLKSTLSLGIPAAASTTPVNAVMGTAAHREQLASVRQPANAVRHASVGRKGQQRAEPAAVEDQDVPIQDADMAHEGVPNANGGPEKGGEVGTQDEVEEAQGTRKRPVDLLESPSPPPPPPPASSSARTIKPFPPRPASGFVLPSPRTPKTPAPPPPSTSPAKATASESSLQRRRSTRPPKTPQRFAQVHTWSLTDPDPSKLFRATPPSASASGSGGTNPKRQRSSSSAGSEKYTASGERRQRRRLRDVRKRPEEVMKASDGRPRVLNAVWPQKKENTVRGIAQTVACDNCSGSAHFACAGISDDVDMLDETWLCPDCKHLLRDPKKVLDYVPPACEGRCIRPTCVLRGKQAIVHKQEDHLEFVVDRIIGQRPDPQAAGNMEYLIAWDCWKVADSTWEPQENLRDIFQAKQKDFHSACRRANIPIRPDSQAFVLLPEAADFFGEDGKLKEGVEGWSRDVESEVDGESRSSSIVPL